MPTVDQIFQLLKQYDPYDKSCTSEISINADNGVDYTLHVDMNPHDEKYGHMWEWWLESSADNFVDGGFEPANDDSQLLNLAAIIHGAMQKSCAPG